MADRVRKPEWLKINIGANERYTETKRIVDSHCLHTICSSGRNRRLESTVDRGAGRFEEAAGHPLLGTESQDRKSTRLNSSHTRPSRMPSSA